MASGAISVRQTNEDALGEQQAFLPDVIPLREEDAYPAEPEEGYGWERLDAEKLCQYYREEQKVFRNIYGPLGTYEGGREKAPAAICRKVALTPDGGEIEVRGDGAQTRSFTYIDDCVEGIGRIAQSAIRLIRSTRTDELISVDDPQVQRTRMVRASRSSSVTTLDKPQDVRGRNRDNSRLRDVLGWEPPRALAAGLRDTYGWIESQLCEADRIPAAVAGAAAER